MYVQRHHLTMLIRLYSAPFVFRGRSFSQLCCLFNILAKEHYQILDVGAGLGRSILPPKNCSAINLTFMLLSMTNKHKLLQEVFARIQVCQDFSQLDDSLDQLSCRIVWNILIWMIWQNSFLTCTVL